MVVAELLPHLRNEEVKVKKVSVGHVNLGSAVFLLLLNLVDVIQS